MLGPLKESESTAFKVSSGSMEKMTCSVMLMLWIPGLWGQEEGSDPALESAWSLLEEGAMTNHHLACQDFSFQS